MYLITETYITVTDLILENKIQILLLEFNVFYQSLMHHFVAGLASHFRDLLVSKTPSNLILLEVGEQAQKMYGLQAQKCDQDFLSKVLPSQMSATSNINKSKSKTTCRTLLDATGLYHFDGEKKS
jgi:DNA polymerase-3 subunit gamma/tau